MYSSVSTVQLDTSFTHWWIPVRSVELVSELEISFWVLETAAYLHLKMKRLQHLQALCRWWRLSFQSASFDTTIFNFMNKIIFKCLIIMVSMESKVNVKNNLKTCLTNKKIPINNSSSILHSETDPTHISTFKWIWTK